MFWKKLQSKNYHRVLENAIFLTWSFCVKHTENKTCKGFPVRVALSDLSKVPKHNEDLDKY